jgi:signal transduction histidine kinase
MTSARDREIQLAFLELGDEDAENLSHLRPLLQNHADGLVSAFYRHLLSFEETHRLLADIEVKERLLVKQREYLLSLSEMVLDEEYFSGRVALGTTHARVGLEPRWYLGAYALYQRLLVPVIAEYFRPNWMLTERIIASLHKRLMLDAQLAMEAYIAGREKRLSFLNSELAAASRELERRHDSDREKLQEASARARATEDLASIATIIAGLAHEIGTPMGVIQGHAELLESSVTDARGRHRLRTIREQIERISQIIQTLLNMARPHGKDHLPVELTSIVRQTVAFLSGRLRANAITVELTLARRASVYGNHDKLQQLLSNLLMNAIDAMPGGGRISISMRRTSEHELELAIADQGHGMSPEVVARIFDPFFTTKPTGGGSGLGLIVAKGIASDHGGSIDVTSSPEAGTRFTLRLPCSDFQSEPSSASGA